MRVEIRIGDPHSTGVDSGDLYVRLEGLPHDHDLQCGFFPRTRLRDSAVCDEQSCTTMASRLLA